MREPIHAARGTALTAKSWQTEAPLRMLMNNLDPENAERPEDLVVYGGTGKAARSWEAYDALVRTLRDLEPDETMLVQSGKPVGVMRTHAWAPRVLIANSNLVGDWANWEEFRRLEDLGLTMYGQMTAGSWIYIGTQGILQGTFETFAAIADKIAASGRYQHSGGTLAGTITLTAGLGGMGGAQPLAVTMNDGVAICLDVDQSRITRRIEHRYLDVQADSLEHAVQLAVAARDARKPLSIGVLGNAAVDVPRLLEMGAPIDIVTDQTSAHDPLSYLPAGVAFEDWKDAAARDPEGFTQDARASMAAHVRAMVGFGDRGAEVFDYGNSIRDEARKGGFDRAFAFPGFVPAYIRPLFCEGKGPFRWAALSGDPADIAATDRAILELFPDNERLRRWITMAQERVHFQGLPARICWLGYGERHRAGLKFNEMVASGELKAPIVIGRDHLDCGSVASPYRETEAMLDGSDAIADWALLNALVNTASGATWVSIHHGGGVGMGRSIHAGQVCVADGTELAAAKIERVLTNDPGMGVIRHVDAGYERAAEVAAERGVRIPMSEPARTQPARRVTFEQMWADLVPVGRSATSGGYFRQPWHSAEEELRSWFAEQAAARGLTLETDAFGNQVAWWDLPLVEEVVQQPPRNQAVLTGSHLDSVLDGGAFDGPLGVVSALAAIDLLRDRGIVPSRPLGIAAFREEEGSRFGLACLGSRLATGSVAWADVAGLRDRDGVALGDVTAAPDAGAGGVLAGVGCYVELHVEQGRALVDRDAPVGLASGIWPHGRYRFDFSGRADHAGTTRMGDRADPMLTYAMTALAANKQARLAAGPTSDEARATFGRVEVQPNGTNAVPSHVTAWLDARAESEDSLADLVDAIARQASDRASRDGTTLTVTPESVSGAVTFSPDLTARLAAGRDLPVLPTQAGHDAGILAAAGFPSAMLFVRNPTGVSHSPAEHAETADCLAGVEALADALAGLAG